MEKLSTESSKYKVWNCNYNLRSIKGQILLSLCSLAQCYSGGALLEFVKLFSAKFCALAWCLSPVCVVEERQVCSVRTLSHCAGLTNINDAWPAWPGCYTVILQHNTTRSTQGRNITSTRFLENSQKFLSWIENNLSKVGLLSSALQGVH